jgi:hypothetical protein
MSIACETSTLYGALDSTSLRVMIPHMAKQVPKASSREFVSYKAVRTANTVVREKSTGGQWVTRDASTGQFLLKGSSSVTAPRDASRVSRDTVIRFSKIKSKK